VLNPCFSQRTNKPEYSNTANEGLGEKDNSFAGSGTNKRKFFSHGAFAPKSGFDHKRKLQRFSPSRKASHSSFQKRQYGKKGLFGRHKSNGWGGKAFRTNNKEDKRLFKGQKNKMKRK
jgi:hypothetical protein